MSALTITASQVHLITGTIGQGTSGEAMTRGQPVYQDAEGKIRRALAGGTALQARVRGMVLGDVGVGDPVLFAMPGSVVDLGVGALPYVLAAPLYVGAAAGQLVPFADLASTNYVSVVALSYSGHLVHVVCLPLEVAFPTIPNISYAGSPFAWPVNVAIAAAPVTNSGGAALFTIKPGDTLPTGLALNSATGAITGTPTVIEAAGSFSVRATNAAGLDDAPVNFDVTA